MNPTVTFPDVEIVRPGTWSAAKGDGTLTSDDVASMVAASQDPEVDAAIMHVGHFDPRFDGEPALGRMRNLRVNTAGVLMGDAHDVPATIAPIIGKAWPRRSAEIIRNLTTPSGRTYPAVLSGVGLLGVARPAVKGLADIVGYYAEIAGQSVDVTAGVSVCFTESTRTTTDNGPHTGLHDHSPPGGVMPLIDQLRGPLGLAADADETAVIAAITQRTADAVTAETLLTEAAAKQRAAEVALAEAVKAKPDEVTVTILADRAAALDVALAAANTQIVALAEANAKRDRDTALDTALADGRLKPAERTEWDTRLAGPHGTAFAVALSERPKVWAGAATEVGTSTFAEGDDTTGVTDAELFAFIKGGR